jgi:hypothetical protein
MEFSKLDEFLSRRIQKLCDNLYLYFGIDKFTFSKWLLIVSRTLLYVTGIHVVGLFFWIWFMACSIPGTIESLNEIESNRKEYFRSYKLVRPNWLRSEHNRWYRLFIFCVFLLFSGLHIFIFFVADSLPLPNAIFDLGIIVYFIFLYVISSVPKPPKRSKLKEWYDGFISNLQPSLQPVRVFE